ncbi:MAG TPA: M23 family metallopeptidase [Rhizomicrobium sp.]|jgi:murein DD-endopeptidase MepM/ murein hydrolase activator NlpD|nr:M23 family metallopeptidase [Rhizomicrobium sp.]
MNRSRKLTLIIAFCAPMLAACTPDTPETQFSWGVNDHLSRPAAPTSGQGARTYAYDGRSDVMPTPKPRPPVQVTPLKPIAQQGFFDRFVGGATASTAFSWPASGRVISSFGTADNGQRNDGINIAMKQGAPIKAAASGTVSYSGDELKDYGNLLLIKHDGGYVTAYAHADRLLVRRGDSVAKGQVIAYAGHTGDVSTPQLHFEIRRGTTPVDPDSLLSPANS